MQLPMTRGPSRRTLLAGMGSLAGILGAPAIVRAQAASRLRFVTRGDPTVLDPLWSTATITRNHSLMVYDYLYGLDSAGNPQPQMLEGAKVEDDGRRWTLVLRDGLLWHDGERVLARDCVASIRRWGARDAFGQALMAATAELSAPDDRTINFRLKQPFPSLPLALGKTSAAVCAMMPERLANTPPDQQMKEVTGSGPFRYKADERVVGATTVYERFAGYKPRDGVPSGSAGPKRVFFDRVEWVVMPDGATAAAALEQGEVDWWDVPLVDLLPMLKSHKDITTRVLDPRGGMYVMILNHVQPPFDNPDIRRAVLAAVDQSEFLSAANGDDPALRHVPTGFFCPGTASDAGLSMFQGPRDLKACAEAIKKAGYKGEPVALMVSGDYPNLSALSEVGADMMRKIGLNVDYQTVDWGTVQQRRVKKDPVQNGGWSTFFTGFEGSDQSNPAGHLALKSSGPTAWFGWPTDPKIEDLRAKWLVAGEAEQPAICRDLQLEAFQSVPYIPLGQGFSPTAYRSNLVDLLDGPNKFWNVRRS